MKRGILYKVLCGIKHESFTSGEEENLGLIWIPICICGIQIQGIIIKVKLLYLVRLRFQWLKTAPLFTSKKEKNLLNYDMPSIQI